MPWPEATDYNEVVQTPGTSFSDPELRQGRPALNPLGLPLPCCGNFAAVYKFFGPDGQTWALKCFTRQVPGLRERYQAVSSHLQEARLPFMVDFQYLQQGIRVHGDWYPVVKMRWVEGLTLNAFLKEYADQPQILDRLARMWVRLAQELRGAAIAHGDLQHGNVLLVPGARASALALRLIDYDGMFVPALADQPSGELGHVNYQHPGRNSQGAYRGEMDRFAHLVIYTSLRCLMVGGRALWERYDNGENLLFRAADVQNPGASALLHDLWELQDPVVRALVKQLLQATQAPLEQVPLLDEVLENVQLPAGAPASTSAPRPSSPLIPFKEPQESPAPPSTVQTKTTLGVASDTRVDAPLPTKPVKGGSRRVAKRAPARGRVLGKTGWLFLAGGAALILGIVLTVILLSLPGEEPTSPVPPPKVAQQPPQPRPGAGPALPPEPARFPLLLPIRDQTLKPGESVSVVVQVDRRGFEGTVPLRIRNCTPAIAGRPPGERFLLPAEEKLDVQLGNIAADSDRTELRLHAGSRHPARTLEFEVEASPPEAANAEALNGLVRRFRVTVEGVAAVAGGHSNPKVLAINNLPAEEPQKLARPQLDVFQGLVPTFWFLPEGRIRLHKVTKEDLLVDPSGGGPKKALAPGYYYAQQMKPVRMVVVTASFPYRAQLEEMRRALRLATVADLKPKFLGLVVERCRLLEGGKFSEWSRLDLDSPASALRRLLRQAYHLDESDLLTLPPGCVQPGLATSRPRVNNEAAPRPVLPRQPGIIDGPKGIFATLAIGDLQDKALRDRLGGNNFEVFRPFGTAPGPPGLKQFPEKCLVRFLDVEVQAGQTYRYRIRVRLANPNYQRVEEVETPELAAGKELPLSDAVVTQPVTVPPEVGFYAVDQKLLLPRGAKLDPASDKEPVSDRSTTVQIHRWLEREEGAKLKRPVGAWLIAERIVAHRGEFLGKKLMVEVPIWAPAKGEFQLALPLPPSAKAKPRIPVDFSTKALLVDFEASKEGYSELLIQDSSGKLLVRSSAHDADIEEKEGRQRWLRYLNWQALLEQARTSGTGPGMKPGKGFGR
jgi:hypothetical protein